MNKDNNKNLPLIGFITNTNNELRKNSANQGWQKTTLVLAMAIIVSPSYAAGVMAEAAGILAGKNNTASGLGSAVVAGGFNKAEGKYSIVLGGGDDTEEKGNLAKGENTLVGAGQENQAYGKDSVILGGIKNITGENGTEKGQYAGVFAGQSNTANGLASGVFAGGFNKVEGELSVVLGGGNKDDSTFGNIAGGNNTVVGGGQQNKAYGEHSVILGGTENTTGEEGTEKGQYAGVFAGIKNIASGAGSAVIAGGTNTASGEASGVLAGVNSTASGTASAVMAGGYNTASGEGSSVIAGIYNKAKSDFSVILGGKENTTDEEGPYSGVLAGEKNIASGEVSAVVAGIQNTANGAGAAVIAGAGNTASGEGSGILAGGTNTASGRASGVIAGQRNTASGNESAVLAGEYNQAKGDFSVVLGGGGKDDPTLGNIAGGNNTVVGGGQANKVYANNSIVFGSDNTVGAEDNKQDKVYILGSGVDASNISNAVVFGDNSTAVSGAISIGSAGGERQIKFVKAGSDQTDAVNFGQLNDLAKATSTDIDVAAWKTKLGVGSGESGGNSVDLNQYYQKTEIYNQNEVDTKLADKADRDAANLSTTDVDKWQRKLGIGTGGVDLTNYYTKVEVQNNYATKNEVAINRQAIISNTKKIKQIEKDLSSGIAAAAAMEAAPYVTGKWTYAAGVAYYNGESAIGATLRRTADTERWSITAGAAASTQGEALLRLGVSGVLD